MSEKPILGVLLGNSAGVRPELVAMLAVKDYYADYCRPVIIGDLRMFEHGLKVVGGDVPHYVIDDLSQCDWSKGYPVLDLKDQDPSQVVTVRPTPTAAPVTSSSWAPPLTSARPARSKALSLAPSTRAP